MLKQLCGVAFILAVTVGSVRAEGQVMAIGAGATSCGSWTQARKTNSVVQSLMGQWFVGFLSGANIAVPDTDPDLLKGQDFNGLMAWHDNYCRAHPLDKLAEASKELLVELGRRTVSKR
jgi:hypothetical protein